jgi:hypothetical protein
VPGLHADYNRVVRRRLTYPDRYGHADSDGYCNNNTDTEADAHTEISADT